MGVPSARKANGLSVVQARGGKSTRPDLRTSPVTQKEAGQTATGNASALKTTGFGASTPASLPIGRYSGAGMGLSHSSDAVNIFGDADSLGANVPLSASDSVAPYQTFDNAAGLSFSLKFLHRRRRPLRRNQRLARIAPVPVPAALSLMGAASGGLGLIRRRHA